MSDIGQFITENNLMWQKSTVTELDRTAKFVVRVKSFKTKF